jgi:hypothetical protein
MKSGVSRTYPSDSSEEGVRRAGWGARIRWTYSSWAKVVQAAGAYACQRGICFLGSSGGGLPNTVMRTRAMPSRCRKAGIWHRRERSSKSWFWVCQNGSVEVQVVRERLNE